MRRNWHGDLYAALKDCEIALKLDPTYMKAHFRMTRALYELGFWNEAYHSLCELKRRFPGDTNNKQTNKLTNDIETSMKVRNKSTCILMIYLFGLNEIGWKCVFGANFFYYFTAK